MRGMIFGLNTKTWGEYEGSLARKGGENSVVMYHTVWYNRGIGDANGNDERSSHDY